MDYAMHGQVIFNKKIKISHVHEKQTRVNKIKTTVLEPSHVLAPMTQI